LFAGLHIEFDVIGNQIADQTSVQIGGSRTYFPVIRSDSQNIGSALPLLDENAFDLVAANLLQKVGVAYRPGGAGTRIEFLENAE